MKIDRVITTPFSGHVAIKATFAALAILAIYIYGWGDGIVAAVEVLFGREMSPRDLTADLIPGLTAQLVKRAIIISAAVALFLWLRTKSTTRDPLRTGFQQFAVAFLIVFAGAAPMAALGSFLEAFGIPLHQYPHPEAADGLASFLYILGGATAGPAEEILMLALVVILMRKLSIGWIPIVVVAVLLRLPFHLYYGWASLAMIFWVIASVFFYKFTNRIWPLVLAHATKNTIGGIYALGFDPFGIVVLLTVVFVGYGLFVVRKRCLALANEDSRPDTVTGVQ